MSARGAGGRLDPRDVALLLGVNLLWGSTYVVGRSTLDTAAPLVVAFVRFALAALLLALLGWHRPRAPWKPDDRRPGPAVLFAVGLVGFGLAKWLHYEGLARSTATDAALVMNMEPVFTALGATLFLAQRLGARQWLGVAVAFTGGVLLLWPAPGVTGGVPLSGGDRLLGNGLMVASVAAEAGGSLLGIAAMRRYTPLQVTAWGTYWGALFLLPPAGRQWWQGGAALDWCTPGNLIALVYLAAGATVLAYGIWYRVLQRVEAGRAAVFLYVQPVLGVLPGVVFRGEWPTAWGALGGLFVLAGIHAIQRGEAPPEVTPEARPGPPRR